MVSFKHIRADCHPLFFTVKHTIWESHLRKGWPTTMPPKNDSLLIPNALLCDVWMLKPATGCRPPIHRTAYHATEEPTRATSGHREFPRSASSSAFGSPAGGGDKTACRPLIRSLLTRRRWKHRSRHPKAIPNTGRYRDDDHFSYPSSPTSEPAAAR